jgi:HEAT repeat protein
LCAGVKTDEALDTILPFTANDWWASTAGRALISFPQTRARETVLRLLAHKDEEVRLAVARALAGQKDPAALDVLLAVAGGSSRMRAYACHELANFPTDKRVVPVLEAAQKDSDSFVREMAKYALAEVRRAGK